MRNDDEGEGLRVSVVKERSEWGPAKARCKVR